MKYKELVIGVAAISSVAAVYIVGKRLKEKKRNSGTADTLHTSTASAVRLIEPVKPEDVGFDEYGHKKHFTIDRAAHKTVLITGSGSYIGESFRDYCEKHYPNIECAIIDMKDDAWHNHPFKDDNGKAYDTVLHVAGIAHADVSKVSEAEKEKYYKVNTDIAIECCRKAKESGAQQFIFMSSMIIYGSQEYIDENTIPSPSNFYGNSKWLADIGVRKLATEAYKVSVLRLPMVYGKGSKGNYPMLSRIAKRVPVFPAVDNRRSMIYVENLCEFVAQLIFAGDGGVYFPQNREYSNTSELVKSIGNAAGKNVRLSKILTVGVVLSKYAPVKKIRILAAKAFGSGCYKIELSQYQGLEYQIYSLEDSIRMTESTGG